MTNEYSLRRDKFAKDLIHNKSTFGGKSVVAKV